MFISSLGSPVFLRFKGLLMALIGAILWGLSGTVAQVLFREEGIRPGWLVTMRLIFAGTLLLAYGFTRTNGKDVWAIWKSPKDRLPLLVFGFGMLGVQYTYFAAIEAGNAATATLLQFLGPVFITFYLALRFKQIPGIREFAALGLALLGTFFLVTNGSLDRLSISAAAVFWGIGAAVTAAFYTLYPVELVKKWGSIVIVGWGMLLGGLCLAVVNPPWQVAGQHFTLYTGFLIGFVIIFGTLIPFYLVLESLRFISAAEVGMLNSAEPLAAMIASVVWLHFSFELFEAIGALCIIATVILLTLQSGKKESPTSHKTFDG
ncbi:EamA family transporter [Effusibacillus consociatus]